jgi:cytochrome c oxidase subunit 2
VSQGFTIGLPEPVSSYAPQVDSLMLLLHVVMVGIFVVWGVFFIYCLVRYRARDGERGIYHQSGEKASFIPDGLILAFEIWLILAFGIPLWASVKQETPPEDQSLVVNLVAQQFAWNFQYPGPDGKFGRRDVSLITASNPMGIDESDPASKDDIISINNLHVPKDKPVILHMTSKDVIHDFQVTNFRNKQDIVPGLKTVLWFKPVVTGKFEIGCAQLCGLGHTQMRGDVFVDTPEDYAAWEKAQLADKAGTADARDAAPAQPSNG